jgi:hypothetical protein
MPISWSVGVESFHAESPRHTSLVNGLARNSLYTITHMPVTDMPVTHMPVRNATKSSKRALELLRNNNRDKPPPPHRLTLWTQTGTRLTVAVVKKASYMLES